MIKIVSKKPKISKPQDEDRERIGLKFALIRKKKITLFRITFENNSQKYLKRFEIRDIVDSNRIRFRKYFIIFLGKLFGIL